MYVKSAQLEFVRGLKETIDCYYDGQPAQAYDKLKHTLNSKLNVKNYQEILKIRRYDRNESFYRIRIKKDNFPFDAYEMFHIPFEKRGIIVTQRYSIPGFPCLYLGSSIYSCWEEMKRPNINDFQAVRLESKREIRHIDLTRPVFKSDDNLRTRDIYHYLMTWPLIACCSIKVKDYSNAFKPEYIIPQLLLQWVRNNEEVDGIKYNSTHIDIHKHTCQGDFSNLVLPVKSNREKGHCPELSRMFALTKATSIQLKDTAMGSGFWIAADEEEMQRNLKVKKIELIHGRPYRYGDSKLGELENYLFDMEAYPI